uniref:SH3 domain-containing protein n=1 Tax=Eptatretus burgeri TaxID=7764 RepID=A0A8C4WU13_EPTBU
MFLHDMKKKRKEIADQKRCKALYDYQADNEDELSLTKGDILEITNTEPSGNEEPSLECLKCVALRDFCGKNPEELFINEGDIIQVTRKFDDGWWHGKVNGQHGMFPSTFVRPIQSEEKTLKPSDADLHYGKALIENFPRTEDELGFQAGAIIFITSKVCYVPCALFRVLLFLTAASGFMKSVWHSNQISKNETLTIVQDTLRFSVYCLWGYS